MPDTLSLKIKKPLSTALAERARIHGTSIEEEVLAVLQEQLLPSIEGKPRTGKELVRALRESRVAGMWKDRKDIGDSQTFARSLRIRAQKRASV